MKYKDLVKLIESEIKWHKDNRLFLSEKELDEARKDIVKVIEKNFISGLRQALYLIKKMSKLDDK